MSIGDGSIFLSPKTHAPSRDYFCKSCSLRFCWPRLSQIRRGLSKADGPRLFYFNLAKKLLGFIVIVAGPGAKERADGQILVC